MATALAFAVTSPVAPLAPLELQRRELRPHDVLIEISFCGVCHSDLHQARNEWGHSSYPMVPGHEIVGEVRQLGSAVTRFALGDRVGVGCMVDSCAECGPCRAGQEQFCERGAAFTYNGTEMDRRTPTYGGYSTHIVVQEHFVLRVPAALELARAAPLLCAGITTYSPLVRWGTGPGTRVAVVGLGGLGHVAVKLARALGAEVSVLSTSPNKREDAARLGAQAFELTATPEAFRRLRGRFDVVLDTVSAVHDYDPYLRLLRPGGTMAVVGIPPEPVRLRAGSLIGGNRVLAGSSIGGLAETQRMLEFCAAHGVLADIELIPASRLNEAYERLAKNDVKYRFVVDLASLHARRGAAPEPASAQK